MFENDIPKHKVGVLHPLSVIDNSPYEFYRLAPPRVMLVMVSVGLAEFSKDDVERVFAPLDSHLDHVMERGIDLVVQNGVPLPILIGVEAHDRMLAHMAAYTGKPATSSVQAVAHAARDVGIRRLALANKWSDAMNLTLGEFFGREGVKYAAPPPRCSAPPNSRRSGATIISSSPTTLAAASFSTTPTATASISAAGPGSPNRRPGSSRRSSTSR